MLSRFDRVRLRDTLRWLASVRGLGSWLSQRSVLLKEFTDYAQGLTEQIKQATAELAKQHARPLHCLRSSSLRKEDWARDIAARDQVTNGLVGVLTAVEPCHTFTAGPNCEQQRLQLRAQPGKCRRHDCSLIDREVAGSTCGSRPGSRSPCRS